MSQYIIDPVTRVAVETPDALVERLRAYVQDLGARVPTFRDSPLTALLPTRRFGVFTYSGSPLALKAHIRVALLGNLRVNPGGDLPTWRAISVDALLSAILNKDPEKSETFDHQLLFIMSPEAHVSDKIQDILARFIQGRAVEGLTTILCTHDTEKWFTGKAFSQEFQALVSDAPEAACDVDPASLVRSWNSCIQDDL